MPQLSPHVLVLLIPMLYLLFSSLIFNYQLSSNMINHSTPKMSTNNMYLLYIYL